TEVKLFSAEDTWWEAAWEIRTSPVFLCQKISESLDYAHRHRMRYKNCMRINIGIDVNITCNKIKPTPYYRITTHK
uniref:hypothetical protein n=1 Tax=Mogibacterium timidum TaxID=35519 RepID=UPI001A980EF1